MSVGSIVEGIQEQGTKLPIYIFLQESHDCQRPLKLLKYIIIVSKAPVLIASPLHSQAADPGWSHWNSEAQALLWEALQGKAEEELWGLPTDLPLRNGQKNCLHLQDEQRRPLAWVLVKCVVTIQCVTRTCLSLDKWSNYPKPHLTSKWTVGILI